MKKIFALLLAMLMLVSVGVFAFADGQPAAQTPWPETTPGTGEGSFGTDDMPLESLGDVEPGMIPVYGTYNSAALEAPTYVVDVSWKGLSFTYHAAEKTGWNPDTLQYSNTSEAHWSSDSGDKGSITLTNKSNADVRVTLAYAPDDSHLVRLRYTRTSSTTAEALSSGSGSNVVTIQTTLDGPGEELEGYVPTPVTFYFMPNKQDPLTDVESSVPVSIGTITITISAF